MNLPLFQAEPATIGSLDIGSELRRYRKANGLKQAAFAEFLGCSQTTISRWESGFAVPTREALSLLPDLITGPRHEQADDLFLERLHFDNRWGSLLRSYRVALELSQADLAEIIDVDLTTVSRWERDCHEPDLLRQILIRKLIIGPMAGSRQLKRLFHHVGTDPCDISIDFGSTFLFGSSKCEDRLSADGHRRGFSLKDLKYGKFVPWYQARIRAGFYRGNVSMSVGWFRYSDFDYRRVEVMPVRLEDGLILSLSVWHACDLDKVHDREGQFRIFNAPRMVRFPYKTNANRGK